MIDINTPFDDLTSNQHAEDSQPTLRSNEMSPDVPGLIPVRMLNEFTYCPRLGYLEFVHGEWEDNLETKQGTFGHRRVDYKLSYRRLLEVQARLLARTILGELEQYPAFCTR